MPRSTHHDCGRAGHEEKPSPSPDGESEIITAITVRVILTFVKYFYGGYYRVRSAAMTSSNSSSAFVGFDDRFEVEVLPVGIEEPAAFWYALSSL